MPDLIPVPRYQQLEALLSFLYSGLREDTYLLRYLCSVQTNDVEHGDLRDRNEIVAATLEHNPFRLAEEGDKHIVTLYDTELPLLAIWEKDSTPVRLGPIDGEQVRLGLVYVFRLHIGNATVSPEAWGARISKAVWWRLMALLRAHTLTGWGTTGDLYTDGAIKSLKWVGKVQRLGNQQYEGLAAELEMTHLEPPYLRDAAGIFDTVAWEGHLATTITDPPSGVVVAGDFDVNAGHDPTP